MLQTEAWHIHAVEIQPKQGGRFGYFVDYNKDNPTAPFTVYNRDGRRVTIPAGEYDWAQHAFEYLHNPSARVTGTIRYRIGHYYDGDFNGVEIASEYRITPQMTASLGWTHQDIKLPYGNFVNNLVPMKVNYSFTTLANISALLQYNGQTGLFSSNVRLALLNRSGTGLFVVFNDRRDLLSSTSLETLGSSFVVKYTRLVDFKQEAPMQSRRKFLRGFSGGVVATGAALAAGRTSLAARGGEQVIAPTLSVADLKPAGPLDEAYWWKVRSQFNILDGMTFMNNGTEGPVPRVVLEANERFFREIAENPSNNYRR